MSAEKSSKEKFLPFEEIEHTADLALRVRGKDLAELCVHAAQGMFSLMRCEPGEETVPVTRRVSVQAADPETLLVEWLNELLYIGESNRECYDRFQVLHLEPTKLVAEIAGRRREPGRVIKAATYSNLHIAQTPGGYEATVTFDV